MGKLSKREIKESLENIPMDTLLLGVKGKGQLTHKQKQFAKGVAKGLTKSDAYRNAYDTQMKPNAVASSANKLAKRPDIQLLIDAYSQANHAKEYHSPLRLRELVIHQLTMHALSEDVPPAQRIKSLELLGKVTEVGAFTERKESVVIHESSKLKQKLLDQLKTIVSEDGAQVTEDEGDKLLKELMGYRVAESSDHEPTHTPPPEVKNDHPQSYTHINPHTQPNQESADPSNAICTQNENSNENKELLTGNISSEDFGGEKGVGVDENTGEGMDVEYREVPPSDFGTKG